MLVLFTSVAENSSHHILLTENVQDTVDKKVVFSISPFKTLLPTFRILRIITAFESVNDFFQDYSMCLYWKKTILFFS